MFFDLNDRVIYTAAV